MNRFLKKCLALTLAVTVAAAQMTSAFAAGALDHFQVQRTYEGQFTDVSGWYAPYVEAGYELGLFDGVTANRFAPNGSLTVAEAVKLAACLHSLYETGKLSFTESKPWWKNYERYCVSEGIIAEPYTDYSNAISKGEFAKLFAAALPEEALSPLNQIETGSIPDVRSTDPYGPAVYLLYRAGVLTGSDESGTFHPEMNLRRSEMAAILLRMVKVSERKTVVLEEEVALSAKQLYARCADAVFHIDTFDEKGFALGAGSGVFLSADGDAVTNWHVIDGVHHAEVTTQDGKTYPISGVSGYHAKGDLALIRVEGSGFTAAKRSLKTELFPGEEIYTIGSPRGLMGSIASGVIAGPRRVINGTEFIQFTAPISNGSSGGALFNGAGELLGITSASVEEGQNLNLAIPVEKLDTMQKVAFNSVAATMQNYEKSVFDTFKITKTGVTLFETESVDLYCHAPDALQGYSFRFRIVNENKDGPKIVGCKWGERDAERGIKLTLIGANAGKATVEIDLNNRSGKVLGTRTITVEVVQQDL